MASKNYYLILGIPRTESPAGVRSAFRDLARQHHPDHAGPAGAARFREVLEAYRVLSDPERRRAYDAVLRAEAPGVPPRHGPRIQPMRGSAFDVVDLFGRPESIRHSADALLDRILRSVTGRGAGKSEWMEPLLCDVALTPSEARRGGVLPIRIPIAAPCPICHGIGHVASFPCRACDADGNISSEMVVPLEVPPGVRSGTILEKPLDRWGIRNLWLRARIGVVG